MTQPLVHDAERLEFDVLHQGDLLQITTGFDPDAWHYDFSVYNAVRHWPSGTLTVTNPSGEVTPAHEFSAHGCGRYTTQRQNPVQQQSGLAFNPYYDGLIVGSFLWGKFTGEPERTVFKDEIRKLLHTPYRENSVLRALATEAGPLSVSDVVELVNEGTEARYYIEKTDVRSTLHTLTNLGRVSLVQKKIQFFKLTQE